MGYRFTYAVIVLFAVTWLHVFGLVAKAQEAKSPLPTEQQRQAVMGLLREVYGAEYLAAETAVGKSALATKILTAAKDTKDPVSKYAMLRLVNDIAIQASDVELIEEVITAVNENYDADAVGMRLDALEKVVKKIEPNAEASVIAAVVAFCEAAIDRDEYQSATRLLTAASQGSHSEPIREEMSAIAERVRWRQVEYENVRPHTNALEENPEDPDANLAVGKYHCFVRNDWETGLLNLAKGSDDGLRSIAELELSGIGGSGSQIEIADRWWQFAQSVPFNESKRVKLHAGYFYQKAIPTLQGLQRAKSEARLKEAESLGEIVNPDRAVAKPAGPVAPQLVPMKEEKIVYDLPASFSDVVVGGSGRYLIFRFDTLKKLGFFDVYARDITHYVPLESADMRFTAGAKNFFIADRVQNRLERWSLETFQREATVRLPLQHPVEVLAMGSASEGLIYAGASAEAGVFLDSRTLKRVSFDVVDHQYQRSAKVEGAGPETRVRVSADGRSFAMWRTGVSPGGFRTYIVIPPIIHTFYKHDTMGYIEPNFDGELMYTSRGVYTNQTKDFLANDGNFAKSFRIPAVTGSYSVAVPRSDDQEKKTANPVHVMVQGQADPILTIPGVAIRPGEYGDFHPKELLTLGRRIYFFPNANLLVTLPEADQSLVLHRVDLQKMLDDSGIDYLYVVSFPPSEVRAGATYKYQIEAKSKHANLRYEIVSGPPGMLVSPQGLVSWRTSRRNLGTQEVIVRIQDDQAQQTTHTFSVNTVP